MMIIAYYVYILWATGLKHQDFWALAAFIGQKLTPRFILSSPCGLKHIPGAQSLAPRRLHEVVAG